MFIQCFICSLFEVYLILANFIKFNLLNYIGHIVNCVNHSRVFFYSCLCHIMLISNPVLSLVFLYINNLISSVAYCIFVFCNDIIS